MTNETAAALLEVAWAYANAGRGLPPHVVADLQDIMRNDTIAQGLRNAAQRVLEAA